MGNAAQGKDKLSVFRRPYPGSSLQSKVFRLKSSGVSLEIEMEMSF